MKKLFLSILICVISLAADANINSTKAKVTSADLQALAKEYYLGKTIKNKWSLLLKKNTGSPELSRDRGRHCEDDSQPDHNTCMDNVCKKIGSYYCDETSELAEVGLICSRIDNSDCIDMMCQKVGSYYCDELSELNKVSLACEGVRNTDCISNVCSKVGSYYCDELSEIQSVGAVCSNIRDVSCIDAVCSRVGSYYCDELSEISEVAKACRGR